MGIRAHLAATLLGLTLAGASAASPFYLFPVTEIEGVAKTAAGETRNLIDATLAAKLFAGEAGKSMQRDIVDYFAAGLQNTYPGSVIHPRQVYDIHIGSGHKFINDNQAQCKQSPSFAVADTYAVVIGITRASLYEVVNGESIDVLVPITLNLQFVKPNMAKIVYTLSETLYSPFRFTKAEYASGTQDGVMREVLIRNIRKQIDSLLTQARNGFNPKDVAVKLVDRDGKFIVTDQGFRAGFVKGQQVEARDPAGRPSVFDVLYVDDSYAVVKLADGTASVGDTLNFQFETAADDSRKPRLMPVLAIRPEQTSALAVAEYFAKDIGFNATFSLSPVDVNFTQTKELITRSANCVTWQKLPAMAQVSGERNDPPQFFLRITPAVSPVTQLSGTGGTKTADKFHTLVAAQVVDPAGRVIYSELGDDDYTIEKTNGVGLGIAQAKEVSLKNATQVLAKNFLAHVHFTPNDYPVTRVDKDRLWVSGWGGTASANKPIFDVLHPLSARAHGQAALLALDLGAGNSELVVEGELVGLPYAIVNPALPKPQRGDVVRLYAQAPPNVTRVMDCAEPTYVGQKSVTQVDYLAPLIRHAIYRSTSFTSYIGDPAFYNDANTLLALGLFDLTVRPPTIAVCSQPGYVIREEAFSCDDPQNCKATVTMGLLARIKNGGELQKTISAGLRTEFSGMQSANKGTFYGYRQLGNGLSMQADFIGKLNAN